MRRAALVLVAVASTGLFAGGAAAQGESPTHEVTREVVGDSSQTWCIAMAGTELDGGTLLSSAGRPTGTATVLSGSCDVDEADIVTPDAERGFRVRVHALDAGETGTVGLTTEAATLALTVSVKESALPAALIAAVAVTIGALLAGLLTAAPAFRVLGELERLCRREGGGFDTPKLEAWVNRLLRVEEPSAVYLTTQRVIDETPTRRRELRRTLTERLDALRDPSAPRALPVSWAHTHHVLEAAASAAARIEHGPIDIGEYVDDLGAPLHPAAAGFLPVLAQLDDLARHRATDPEGTRWSAVDKRMTAWPSQWAAGDGGRFGERDTTTLDEITELAASVARQPVTAARPATPETQPAEAAAMAQPASRAPGSVGPPRDARSKRGVWQSGILRVAASLIALLVVAAGVLMFTGDGGDGDGDSAPVATDSSPATTSSTSTTPTTPTTPTTEPEASDAASSPVPALLLGLLGAACVVAVLVARRSPSARHRAAFLARRAARAPATPYVVVAVAGAIAAVGVFNTTYGGSATYAGWSSWRTTAITGLTVGAAGGLAATVAKFRLARPHVSLM